MKLTAFLLLLLVVKSFSLKCNRNFECTGSVELCDGFKSSVNELIGDIADGKIQTCRSGYDRCADMDFTIRANGLDLSTKIFGCLQPSNCNRNQLQQNLNSVPELSNLGITISINKLECCTGDFCNNSSSMQFSILLIFGSLIYYLF